MPATEAQAGPVRGLDAAALGDVLAAVLDLVRDHEDELNRLNVFPVRDHDTGTNMTLTLEGAVKAVEATSGRPMRELARAVVATTGQLAALRRAGVVDAAARGFELCVRAFATTVAEEGPRAAPSEAPGPVARPGVRGAVPAGQRRGGGARPGALPGHHR